MWYTQGKFEALEFVLENTTNLEQIKIEVQEVEEHLVNPVLLQGPMAPRTSTRLNREGYLAGLKEALNIISQTPSES